MTAKLLSEIKDTEPRRAHGDITDLKASIASVGLINPLTIDEDGQLLAGRRRYQAIKELGWTEVEVTILPVTGDQLKALRVAIDENVKRKQLTEVEEAIANKEYDELMRKIEGESKGGQRTDLGQSLTKVEGWSQEKTAKDLGVSRPKISRDIKIATAIEKYPELAKETGGQAVLRQYKRKEVGIIPFPIGKFRTIVIDPPWPVEKILREDYPNQFGYDYPTLTIEKIKGLPIPDLVFDDGTHLYLWTTQRYLPVAFDILKEWGFNYIFTLVWHKNGGFQPFNLPQYNCEFVLFGKNGSLDFLDTKNFFTCFEGKRREHSRKPQEFYDLIRRVSPEPRIDYFSREKREGFVAYGNETNKY